MAKPAIITYTYDNHAIDYPDGWFIKDLGSTSTRL
jgi:hypothetical protein